MSCGKLTILYIWEFLRGILKGGLGKILGFAGFPPLGGQALLDGNLNSFFFIWGPVFGAINFLSGELRGARFVPSTGCKNIRRVVPSPNIGGCLEMGL